MDTHQLFTDYLAGWPDEWISFEVKANNPKGTAKMRDFFKDDTTKLLFDDLLEWIKVECVTDKNCHETLTCSDWLGRYFHSYHYKRVKDQIGLASHELLLMTMASGVEPLKSLLDGFVRRVISMEVAPCIH